MGRSSRICDMIVLFNVKELKLKSYKPITHFKRGFPTSGL